MQMLNTHLDSLGHNQIIYCMDALLAKSYTSGWTIHPTSKNNKLLLKYDILYRSWNGRTNRWTNWKIKKYFSYDNNIFRDFKTSVKKVQQNIIFCLTWRKQENKSMNDFLTSVMHYPSFPQINTIAAILLSVKIPTHYDALQHDTQLLSHDRARHIGF